MANPLDIPALDEGVGFDVEVRLRPAYAALLIRHAERRSMAPVEVMAALIDSIFVDDLFDAILDDGEPA